MITNPNFAAASDFSIQSQFISKTPRVIIIIRLSMLAILGCFLLVTTIVGPAVSHPYQDQNSEGALDYKLFENRLDQLELKLQNS